MLEGDSRSSTAMITYSSYAGLHLKEVLLGSVRRSYRVVNDGAAGPHAALLELRFPIFGDLKTGRKSANEWELGGVLGH